jgi:hypothetical protein
LILARLRKEGCEPLFSFSSPLSFEREGDKGSEVDKQKAMHLFGEVSRL